MQEQPISVSQEVHERFALLRARLSTVEVGLSGKASP